MDESALEQLIEAQEKLAEGYGRGRSAVAIGIYDASDVVFPVHYAAADPDAARFVPLGMDTGLTLREILSEHPTGETYAHLLEDFDRFPLITDSRGAVLSMPPVINSRTRAPWKQAIRFCSARPPEPSSTPCCFPFP